jgi:hypothetical protein
VIDRRRRARHGKTHMLDGTLVEAAFTTMLIYKHAEPSIGCIVRGVLCCGEFELNVNFETSLGVVLFSVDREISLGEQLEQR